MIHLLLLLAQPQGVDTSAYASPALRALVQHAAAANAAPPANLRGFGAHYEASIGLVKRLPDRIEGASTVEQTAGQFTWVADRGYGQHQQGYRVVTTGVPLPGAAALSDGWIIPSLTGPKYHLFGAASGAQTEAGIDSLGDRSAWSPLGPDRERYYRFAGGDTIAMEFPDGTTRRVVRIIVTPRAEQGAREKVFNGDLYLDPGTGVLRRLRGQFLTLGGVPYTGMKKVFNSLVVNALIADIVNSDVQGAGVLPTYQRVELAVVVPLTTESWSLLRVVTQLTDIRTEVAGAEPAPAAFEFQPGRTAAPGDSIAAYRGWDERPDKPIDAVYTAGLLDVGPDDFRPVGPPIYFWRGPTTLELLRFNRVEGLYTGVSGTLDFRNAMPGLRLRGTAGYAWWPGLPRGGMTATLTRGRWATNVQAIRDLDLATKFPDPLNYNRGLQAVFQADNYDYVDRVVAGAGLTRFFEALGPGGVTLRADWVRDRSTNAELSHGPFGQSYTLNPNVDPYDYPRVWLDVQWNPEISSHFVRGGIGLHAKYEAGWGDLPYQRIQAGFVARANWRQFTFTIVGDAGATVSDEPPTQQLFLIGGSGSLPGYDYDQFGGNVGVLTRWMLAAPLPFLQAPLKVGSATIPPIAPNLSYRVYSGYTETTNDGAAAALNAVGTQLVNGVPAPFSVPSNRIVSTQEIRLSLLGTLLGFGVAKPFEAGTDWTFTFSFAQSF